MTKFGTLTPNGVVNEMEIDLNKVESDDPIAYSRMGLKCVELSFRAK